MVIKTPIAGDVFKLVTMMLVDDGVLTTLVNITDSIWEKVHQQHQRTFYYWSEGMGLSQGHLNSDKGYWYPIKCI